MKLRGEVGGESIGECFRQRRWNVGTCLDILDSFLAADPKNDEMRFQTAKVVRLQTSCGTSAPDFAAALKATKDKKLKAERCTDDETLTSAKRGLSSSPKSKNAQAGIEIAFKHCYKELSDDLFEEFLEGNSTFVQNSCKGFKKKKRKLTALQKAECKDHKGK